MSSENTKKTITNCAKAALFFEIVAFICLISAAVVALLNTEHYSYYGKYWYYDDYAFGGGIVEIVATILCFVSIILSSIIASGKINKMKGIAVGNVVIVTLFFIFSATGMGVLLASWYAYEAGLIPGTMALCSAFIALILVAVVLGLAKKNQETKAQIYNLQQQTGANRQYYTYSNYATVQTRMSADSAAKALRDYKILHESGLLTDREFAEQKAKILKQLEI